MVRPVAGGPQEKASGALHDAARLALEWGLVEPADITDGDLRVSSSVRRNFNLRIERRNKPSYLIKRPDLAAEAAETVATESSFYEFCAREPTAAPVAAIMPPLVASKDSGRTLVLELVRGGRSPWHAYHEHGPPELPPAPPAALGRILGALHATFEIQSESPAPLPLGLRDQAPAGYFRFHLPHPEMLRTASLARLELCRCLQQEPSVATGLAAAHDAWRTETVIHGDVRSENILIVGPAAEPEQVLLVDWELVQIGDPAWDLAGAFEDHVRFWIHGMSQQTDLAPVDRMSTAAWPLPAIQTAIRCLCQAYAEAVGRAPIDLTPLILRAVPLSAARMFQTAWEHCRYLDRPSSLSVLLLQVAVNLLTDPERYAAELYGLDEVLLP